MVKSIRPTISFRTGIIYGQTIAADRLVSDQEVFGSNRIARLRYFPFSHRLTLRLRDV